MKILVKYHDKDIDKIEPISKGSWIDLRAAETVTMKAGEWKLISLGVSMELPCGWEAILAPRSSAFKKYGILVANSFGVIDNSYCGDGDIWKLSAYATRDVVIPKNDRIAQFRLETEQPHFDIEEVKELRKPDRGGFGSTGNNNFISNNKSLCPYDSLHVGIKCLAHKCPNVFTDDGAYYCSMGID